MSARVKKNFPLLKWLSEAKPKSVKSVLNVVDKEVLDSICECCYNVLKGNVPLKPDQKRKLRRHRGVLRQLSSKSTSLKRKRQLAQRGGLWGSLLIPLVGLLGSVLLR